MVIPGNESELADRRGRLDPPGHISDLSGIDESVVLGDSILADFFRKALPSKNPFFG